MIITALCALPFSALAEDYGIWVGGTQVTSTNKENVLGDGTISYNAQTNTLILNNANIQMSYETYHGTVAIYTTDNLTVIGYGTVGNSNTRFGIYAEDEKNLTLNGDFTITGSLNGIYSYNNKLLIKGGNINVTGGINGIFASGNGEITLNGGNVSATGNGETNSYGSGIQSEKLIVNGGSLTATGGTNGNLGYGISSSSLSINGGRVTAIGNNNALFTAPTLASNVTALASYNTTGTGAVSYDASLIGSYKWFRSTYAETFDFYAVGDCFTWGFTPGNSDGGLRNNGDGTYSRTFTAVKAVQKAMLKVTDGASQWYGDELGRNYTFTITGAGEFTVTYYSSTNKVSVCGDVVDEYVLPVSSVTAIGTGKNNFLNDEGWTFSDDNKLSEVTPGVWEIAYDNVGAGNYEFKFALDGGWTSNFGPESSATVVSGMPQNAKYNASSNIAFNVENDNSTVKLQLDLSNYRYITDSGAKFTVTIFSPEPTFTVTYDFNGGTKNGESTYVTQQYAYAPAISVRNFIEIMEVTPPAGKELDAIEVNGVRYELGSIYMLNQDTNYKYLWKDIAPIVTETPKATLSSTSYTYDGKVKTPLVTVKVGAATLKKGTDYTVAYAKGRKNVGAYKVTVIYKGKYSGKKGLTFKINPKGTSVSKATSPKKSQIKVTWKKQTSQTTGYQIQYSASSKFTAKATKTVWVNKNKTTSKTISKLKSKKKYYVRIRTYKTLNKTKYYSGWKKYSKAITVK